MNRASCQDVLQAILQVVTFLCKKQVLPPVPLFKERGACYLTCVVVYGPLKGTDLPVFLVLNRNPCLYRKEQSNRQMLRKTQRIT